MLNGSNTGHHHIEMDTIGLTPKIIKTYSRVKKFMKNTYLILVKLPKHFLVAFCLKAIHCLVFYGYLEALNHHIALE